MKYLVVVLPQAHEDVEIIVSWLHQRSLTGATAWYRRWSAMLDELSRSADRCVEAPESADHSQQLHQLQFKTRRGHHYRVIFVIQNSKVYVLHVRGSGQDLLSPDEIRHPDEPLN
ncbi:MAG TPA: hypothetical protein VL132_01420 [Planctomycetaceae bacterium]|nr:hypothetical protein [Planctomycetaceae bacterium]